MTQKQSSPELTVDGFLDAVADEARRADARELLARLQRITGLEARMWGPSMVGFGSFHYRYASGREGDMFLVGFSPRKSALTLYLTSELDAFNDLLVKLGPHKRGVGCLYLKRLGDADEAVLEAMLRRAVELNRAAHVDREKD